LHQTLENLDAISDRGDVVPKECNVSNQQHEASNTNTEQHCVTTAQLGHEVAPQSSRSESEIAQEQLPSNEKDLAAELRRLRQEKRCKICLDRDSCMVFLPCGHMCACLDCTQRLKQCPLCRRKIDKAYKTY